MNAYDRQRHIGAVGERGARNLRIQKMLRMIGYGENIGSGFPMIVSAWDEKKWIRPELIEEPDLMQVKLVLYINGEKDGIKDVTKDGIKEQIDTQSVTDDKNGKNDTKSGIKDDRFGIKDGIKELTERQQVILNCIKANTAITTVKLAQKTNIPWRTIMREISDMQDMGILSREGGRKDGVWVVK